MNIKIYLNVKIYIYKNRMATHAMMPRLMRDVRNLEKANIDKMGIYYYVDEKDIRKIKCMIIGQSDTPYEYGFYFFDIYIVDDYPFKPPSVTYQTRKDNIRFNPNLYCCGKVCLSIINTWAGPQWTSCQSPRSVMISLQTLLHENPLHNEPGFENCDNVKNKNYNELIKHENYSFSIYHVVKYGICGFECFSDKIKEYFIKNYEQIYNNLDELIEKYKNKQLFTSIYNMTVKNNYMNIKKKIVELHTNILYSSPQMIQLQMDYKNHQMPNFKQNEIRKKQAEEIEEAEGAEIKEVKIEKVRTEKKRLSPNKKPNKYEIGYKMISENNGLCYIVAYNKSNVKYWKKIK